MNTLQLCDSFEPYYAGRKSFLKSPAPTADTSGDAAGGDDSAQPKNRETLVSSSRTSTGSMNS